MISLAVGLAPVAAAAAAKAPTIPGHRAKSKPGPRVRVTLTSANLRQALSPAGTVSFAAGAAPALPTIAINGASRYQTMRSVGGAMTDTSAWLIQTGLAPGTRAWLMRRLFGAGGLHLGFLRLPIGASDFTAAQTPYTYDELAAGQTDVHLSHFSIAHDLAYIIPAIREALAENPKTFMLASPWSPP
ncbi:MAG: hypothetical protein ACRDK8_05145, partial [Solirubrobacteraceae bacterium]